MHFPRVCCVVVAIWASGAAALPGAPVAYWNFDDGTGSTQAANQVVGGPAATLRNMAPATAWVAGRFNTALDFDRVDDYLDAPLNISESQNTTALWIRTSYGGAAGFFSVNKSTNIAEHDRNFWTSGGNISGRIWNDETISTAGANYADGQWHHVVHQYGAGVGHRLYVDGVLRATGVKSSSNFDWQDIIRIGWTNPGGYFSGQIDDVAVWDEALTTTQIQALAAGTATPLELPAGAVRVWAAGVSDWHVGANWTGGAVPTADDEVYVTNGGTAQISAATGTAQGAAVAVGGLGATAGSAIALTGGTLATPSLIVGTNGRLELGDGALAVGAVRVDGGTLRALSSFSTNQAITLGSGGMTVDSNGLTPVLSGPIDGAGGLVKAGGGTLTLSGANTYSGLTRVNNGGGTLRLSNPTGLSVRGNIQLGSSGSGAAVLELGASHQIDDAAVVEMKGSTNNWTYFKLLGQNETVGGISDATGAGVIENTESESGMAADSVLTVNNAASFSYNGYLRDRAGGTSTGTFGLVKAGGGALTLSGGNIRYTGPTTVAAGLLRLENALNFASNVANGATVELAAGTGVNWQFGSGRTLSGSGVYEKTGPGRVRLWNVIATPSGQINVREGILGNDGNACNWAGSTAGLFVAAGATFDMRADSVTVGQLTGAGRIDNTHGGGGTDILTVSGGDFSGVVAGSGSGAAAEGQGKTGLTKVGPDVLILSGTAANTYSGPTTVTGGKLVLGKSAGVQAIGGPLAINLASGWGNSATGVELAADEQIPDNAPITFGGPDWSAFRTKGFTETVAGLSSSGKGIIENSGQGQSVAAHGKMIVHATADYSFNGIMRNTESGSTGTLALQKRGAGRQTLASNGITYTGATAVDQGTLELVDTTGFVSPLTVAAGAAVTFNSSQPMASKWRYQQPIGGAGTVNKTGSGVTLFNKAVNLSGQINVVQGTLGNDDLSANWSAATADLFVAGGANLDLRGNHVRVDALTGAGNVINSYGNGTNTLTVGAAGGSAVFDGAIAGSGSGAGEGQGRTSVVKTGAGTLTLRGASTYAGPLRIEQGTVRLEALPAGQPFPGSALWLDAADPDSGHIVQSGGGVSVWKDRTGGVGQVAQADPNRQPVFVAAGLNGLPVVRFSAVNAAPNLPDLLYNTTDYGAPVTVFSVSQLTGGANYRLITSTINNWLLGYWGGRMDQAYYNGWVNNPATTPDTLPHMYEAVIPGGTANSELYVYDARNPAGVQLVAANGGGRAGPNGLALGGWQTSAGEASNGDVAEVLIYQGALSPVQRQFVESYLLNKWFGTNFATPAVNILPDAAAVIVAGGTLDLGGVSETVGAVTLQSGLIAGTGGTLTGSSFDLQSGTVTANLAGAAAAVTKTTVGTVRLEGVGSYGGATTVSEGTLLINGAIAGGGGGVTVAGGATLGGGGNVARDVLLLDGARLAPGVSPGTLTVAADLTFSPGSLLDFELAAPNLGNSPASDRVDVLGDLALDGLLNVSALDGFGSPSVGDQWRLFNYTGLLDNRGLELGSAPALAPALFFIIDTTTPGQVNLLVQAPEPSALGLIGLGLALVFAARRRGRPGVRRCG